MAQIPIDECPAGAVMDATVTMARGWKRTDKRPRDWQNWSNYPDEWYEKPDGEIENVANVPKFSTDIAVAWELCEAIQKASMQVFVRFQDLISQAKLNQFEMICLWNLPKKEAALHIARAFLKANGVEFVESP